MSKEKNKINPFWTPIKQWLAQEQNKTVFNQIIVNLIDKLIFATLAASLAFWFNSQLGNQSLIGDYQKEIYMNRQKGYIEIHNEIKSVDRVIASYLIDNNYIIIRTQTRLLFQKLETQIHQEKSGSSGGGFASHEYLLDRVTEKLDKLISITENYEIYFPEAFFEKINLYILNVIQTIEKTEIQIKKTRDNIISHEKLKKENKARYDNLVKLQDEIINLIKTRLKIEGIILG